MMVYWSSHLPGFEVRGKGRLHRTVHSHCSSCCRGGVLTFIFHVLSLLLQIRTNHQESFDAYEAQFQAQSWPAADTKVTEKESLPWKNLYSCRDSSAQGIIRTPKALHMPTVCCGILLKYIWWLSLFSSLFWEEAFTEIENFIGLDITGVQLCFYEMDVKINGKKLLNEDWREI